jgi:uncharacterized protein DUF1616
LAERNTSLDIGEDSSLVSKTAVQPNRKMNRKEISRDDFNDRRKIEALVLEKSVTRAIPLWKLVRDLSDELGCKPDTVISEIIKLQAGKKILIREPAPYRKFPDYLLSPISTWFWEAVLATLASLSLILATPGWALYLRYVFGSLMVLFLPGHSLIGLIYSKKDELDYLTRIALSFVMSLAIATLVGLVLNYTPFGISLIAVAASLSAITLSLLFLTALRRYAYYTLARDSTWT